VSVTPLARCPASHRAPFLPCRPIDVAQAMAVVKNAGQKPDGSENLTVQMNAKGEPQW
jgi:hypothetical protein